MTAPSFSSFPASFKSFPELENEAGSSSRPADALKDRHSRTHKAEGKRKRDEGDEKRKKRSKDLDRNERPKGEKSNPIGRSGERPKSEHSEESKDDLSGHSRLFYADRRGDTYNVAYGGLHAGDVPKYHLVARGRTILGLEGHWSVFDRSGKGIEVGPSGQRKVPQLTDRSTRALLTTGKTRRLIKRSRLQDKYEEVDGYLRLPSRAGGTDDQAYRSITKDSDPNSDSSSDAASDGPSGASEDDSDTTPLSAREEALKTLEQNLRNEPTSTRHWVSLLEHSLGVIPFLSKGSDKARSEIAISVLARALEAHPDNGRSAILRLKYLHAGEGIWNENKLDSEWETALRITGDADVWMEWLDWKMSRSSGGIDAAMNASRRASQDIAAGQPPEGSDVERLRVFLRLAIFLKQAGYVERALALFQAQAELSFFGPERTQGLPFDQKLDELEEFWEAEVPRVGEHGSKGWKSWSASDQLVTSSAPSQQRNHDEGKPTSSYERWAVAELLPDREYRLPTRSFDEDDSDPFATVLFSDIRSLVIHLRTNKGREVFRLMWLSFLGLHIPGFTRSLSSLETDSRWAEVCYSTPSFLDALLPSRNAARAITADSMSGVMVGKEKTYRNSFDLPREWDYDVREPLECIGLDGSGRMWESYDGNVELIRSIFSQLRVGQVDTSWDVMSLAFEAALNLKAALKHSRSLLAASQSSSELWINHARLERMRGRYDDARKVYETVLSSYQGETSLDAAQIWWDYAEMEWLLSRPEQSTTIALRAAGQSQDPVGVNILRAKRYFEEAAEQSRPEGWKRRLCWIKLRILLELVSGNTSAAVAVTERYVADESLDRPSREALTTAFLIMIYQHSIVLKNPTPPSLLRGLVHGAMEHYPNNSIILGLFLECEKGEGLWGRVRSLLNDHAGGQSVDKTLERRVAEVWIAGWESGRWEGEVERVRGGLEAATMSDRTRGSWLLWRIFVEFEIRAGNLKRAKTVLFRALGECPAVKELYLLAFGPLRPVFTTQELASFADTMAERGLRLRMSIDDVVTSGAARDGEGRSDGSDSDDDELGRDSRELRRLMPY